MNTDFHYKFTDLDTEDKQLAFLFGDLRSTYRALKLTSWKEKLRKLMVAGTHDICGVSDRPKVEFGRFISQFKELVEAWKKLLDLWQKFAESDSSKIEIAGIHNI
ncbi:hypothetical protein H8S90_05010 [Olivibacter sp. SDN3]|uniref:hypothetical protein n=1 Tax=Olivibacter sp. SDN3 TaxID=2764720 RepID=UPI00165103F9|nr:hypothetical protein [Olivibacter sp. SDN3]QNL50953.1 hypothetical protein H8S90_05010 [Olivibacter sp. SDN3]